MGSTYPAQLMGFFQRLGPRLLLSLLLLMPQPGLALDIQLPDLGDPADAVMTPAAEQRLGRAFVLSIRAQQRFIEEPVFEDYIESLGRRLANHTGGGHNFHFHLIQNNAVNAFAGPDGHIGIYTGLVTTSQSEDELASVLAHEIAHVTQKHLFRAFHRAQQMSGPAAVALLAAVLLGAASGNADISKAGIVGVQGAAIQDQINYTRHNEEEADRVGISLLAKSKFDPRAMPAFFARMGKATQTYSSGVPEFLRTHPVTTNRIADSQSRAEKYPYTQRQEDLRYALLRAWLKAKSYPSAKQALTFFQNSLKTGRFRNREAEEYGYAIALTQARDYAQGRELLNRLLQHRPQIQEYRVALAQLERASDNLARAHALLDEGLRSAPDSKPYLLAKVELLEAQGRFADAVPLLERLVRRYPQDARLYKRLGHAQGRIGKQSQGYANMAEHYYLNGELKLAVQQLEVALRGPRENDFQAAKLAARLKTYKQELQEQMKAQRQ